MDVNGAVSLFYSLVDGAIRDHIPTVDIKRRFPPWASGEARRALQLKQAAFERVKRHPSDPDVKADFRQKRSEYKRVVQRCYTEYLEGLLGEFGTNPKRFWSFLKCFKQSKGISVLESNGVPVADDVSRANLLNRTFASKFSDPTVQEYPEIAHCALPAFSRFEASEDSIRSILRSLNVGKACGPDGLSARVLKECADELAVPLCKLFNLSLSRDVFPEQWAEANIVPIHKKGSRKHAENYRSVSLLPLCAKVFKKVIYD